MNDGIRKRMRLEMQSKEAFDIAHDAAFAYADGAASRNVFPTDDAIAALASFDEALPENPGDACEIVSMLDRYGSPATVSQIAGRYFGLVNGGVIPASLAVRWLTDFWDQNTPLYLSSPVASRLEQVTEDWLRQLFGLPRSSVAGFVSGSSLSIFCGLAAARQRNLARLDWDVNRRGLADAPRLRLIASRQAHGTVSKAIALLGFGLDNVEWVDADDAGRIDSAAVPELDQSCILLLQAGNVNSGAFDDFENLGRRANEAGAWVHVDGAFGLWAAVSEELCYLTRGIELADSIVRLVDGLKQVDVPVLTVEDDTLAAAAKVMKIRAAIAPDNDRKIAAALGVFGAGVDADELEQRIDIAVRFSKEQRTELAGALASPVQLENGRTVPLRSFLELSEEQPVRELVRRNQRRMVTLPMASGPGRLPTR